MKRLFVNLLRFSLSAAILVYLITEVRRDDPQTFTLLLTAPKNWAALIAAWFCCALALGVGFVRWWVLIRGLGLRARLRDVVRIGVLGFMLDFAALGALGGDLVKAVLLAREQRERRVEAAATVVADRIVGLLMLLTVAAVMTLWTGAAAPEPLLLVGRGIALAAVGAWTGVAAAFAFVSFRWEQRVSLSRFGALGELFQRVVEATRIYRRNPSVLLLAALLALTTVSLNVTGFYLLSAGFPVDHPTWLEHWRIVPAALLSGIIPLPADTLGVLDYAMSYLYGAVTGGRVSESLGLLVMMSYRVVSIAVATAGLVIYLSSGSGRGELSSGGGRSS